MTALEHCKDFCYQWAQDNWDVIANHIGEDTLEEFLAASEKLNVAWMLSEFFIWGNRTPDKSVFHPVPDQGRIFWLNGKYVKVDWQPYEDYDIKIEFTEKKTRMVEEEYWT